MKTHFSGLQFKDFVTLASVAAGVASIAFSLEKNFAYAAVAIAFAAAFDFLDGKVARSSKGGDAFGRELDSLVDAFSFGAAPAALVLSQKIGLLAGIAAVAYTCAGVVRLARFNLQERKGVFVGLPIPAAAVIVSLAASYSQPAGVAAMLLAAVAMVLDFELKKI